MSLERYQLAESLGEQPSEASARQLIAMLGDDKDFMIDDGSIHDVVPTWGRVSDAAHGSLVKMLPVAVPVIIEALASATVEMTRALLSVLDEFPIEQRVALSDEAHAAIESATKKLGAKDAEGARLERDLARRVRANEIASREAFWRAWLAHPSRAFRKLYKLPDVVEDKRGVARELVAWWLEHPDGGRYAVCSVLERLPGVLPPETVRALVAAQLPREDDMLVPVLAAYGEPAAALIPQCLEMLRNEPLADDETLPPRYVRWHRATTALVRLVDALDPRTLEVLEPMLVEMAANDDDHYRDCATLIRDALRRTVPLDVVEPERGLLVSLRSAESLDARAVYADWLEEQGRSAHAAIVRTTVQIQRLLDGEPSPGGPSIEALRDRLRLHARLSSTPVWWQRIVVPSTMLATALPRRGGTGRPSLISVVQLRPPQETACGDYDLDSFVVELDGAALDFRLELGLGVGIFWAVPADTGDRLRLFHVDGAAYTVDEPELYEDPFVFDLPLTSWHGELGELGDGSVVIAVTIEASANPPSYRCEVTRRTVDGETQTETFAWEQ